MNILVAVLLDEIKTLKEKHKQEIERVRKEEQQGYNHSICNQNRYIKDVEDDIKTLITFIFDKKLEKEVWAKYLFDQGLGGRLIDEEKRRTDIDYFLNSLQEESHTRDCLRFVSWGKIKDDENFVPRQSKDLDW